MSPLQMTDRAMGVLSDPPGLGTALLKAEREMRSAAERYRRTLDPWDKQDWFAAIARVDALASELV